MTIDRFCDLLPDTGSSVGLTGMTLAIALTLAGAGFLIMARRGGMRTAAMALMPIALLVPAGTQSDTSTNAQKPAETQRCVERPWDNIDIQMERQMLPD